MKPTLLFILISFVSFNLLAQAKQKDFHKKLKWLIGTWQIQNDSDVFEAWNQKEKNFFEGIGYTSKNGQKEVTEKMKLMKKDNKLFFVADVPHNKKEIEFEITSWNKKGFTAENPHHDFPKKIIYQKQKRKLVVMIAAEDKQQTFTFTKTNQ